MHTHSLSIHPDSGHALRPWELALLLAVCVTLLTGTWAQARSQLLAARLVRLHVIAVSDDDAEQAVKLQVRDAVLAYLEPQLADVADIGAAQQIIAGDLDGIARAAQAAAGERPVRVSLGPEHYPTRDYGTFALPAGVYTSLRVTLGAGAGHNWWCVIFPPLRRGITITANAVRVGQATGKELNFDMKRAILDARSAGDSVGSELECVVTGVPAGVGGLLFGGMESRIAGMLYAIPGVKGVEFGRGFALAEMRGSEANDPIRLKNGRITMASNNAGGINGGITNGMPLVVRMALRPTPSIACEQPSVDLVTMEETPLRINGRHDPCLAPRAIPVMEAALACCVLDAMLDTAATI